MAQPTAWVTPDAFGAPNGVGGAVALRAEVTPYITGSALSSHDVATWWFNPVNIDTPVAVANLCVYKSFNASVPQATSANSSGTERYSYQHGVSLFTRQDYGANSTNLSCIKTGSFGLTAGMTYSSGSQSYAMSWVTDTTGGLGTFSTTSGAGNWSRYATGQKVIKIPIATVLPVGEYFIAHKHGSTAATTGSSVVLLSVSNLHIVPQELWHGVLGSTNAYIEYLYGPNDIGFGAASAVTTNATMAGSVLTHAAKLFVQYLSAF
jgi:hypothetical protein